MFPKSTIWRGTAYLLRNLKISRHLAVTSSLCSSTDSGGK